MPKTAGRAKKSTKKRTSPKRVISKKTKKPSTAKKKAKKPATSKKKVQASKTRKAASTKKTKKKSAMAALKKSVMDDLRGIKQPQKQLEVQRDPIVDTIDTTKHKRKKMNRQFIKTGVEGFDDLLDQGVPKGAAILVAGGAGSGKTIFNLQILAHHASKGKKCLYMSFEEPESRLKEHMDDFGWDAKALEKKGTLKIQRINPFDVTRSVDALLLKAKGELLIDIEPVIFPKGFNPDFVVVDSLTAIASAFSGKEDSYRIYIEQLFRFFESGSATAFLITETKQIPTIFSQSGVEEFLADGVIVLYSIKRGNIREKAIEILKLRGANHQKKIVAFEITDDGIVVYPDQEVFEAVGD